MKVWAFSVLELNSKLHLKLYMVISVKDDCGNDRKCTIV